MKIVIAALLLMMSPFVARADEPTFKALTPQEVNAKLKQKNFYVFDNNDPDMFKGGHVPGAKWLSPSDYDAKALPADKSATLVFYCHNEH
jgi:hypothetical protein